MSTDLMKLLARHIRWAPHPHANKVERIRFLTIALSGEVGEFANLVKKDWRGDPGDRYQEAIKELADIGNYLFMLAHEFDINLNIEMCKKLIEVEQRPEWRDRQ